MKKRRKPIEVTRISLLDLQVGPVRHQRLDERVLKGIKWAHDVLSEVDGSPFEQWVEDFRREMHPEREVRVFEHIAFAYAAFCRRHPGLTLEQKCEAYSTLVAISTGRTPIQTTTGECILIAANVEVLSREQMSELERLYGDVAEPSGDRSSD